MILFFELLILNVGKNVHPISNCFFSLLPLQFTRMPRRSTKSSSRRNVKRLGSSRSSKQKLRGGSAASERVMKLVPKQCDTFVSSTMKPSMKAIPEKYGGYNIQAGGGEESSAMQGSCPNTTSFIQSDHDNYYRWRGNEGDSNAFGSSVPSNFFQDTSDWFNGKNTIFTPSKFDASAQNEARYFTDKGNGAMLNMPKLMNKKVEVPMGSQGPETVRAAPFNSPYRDAKAEHNGVPLFRAGRKKRRNATRRQRSRRHTRRSNRQQRRR